MSRMIYDCTDKDLLYKTSNHTALGMDGHIHMQVNKTCSIDMNNGTMHFTPSLRTMRARPRRSYSRARYTTPRDAFEAKVQLITWVVCIFGIIIFYLWVS